MAREFQIDCRIADPTIASTAPLMPDLTDWKACNARLAWLEHPKLEARAPKEQEPALLKAKKAIQRQQEEAKEFCKKSDSLITLINCDTGFTLKYANGQARDFKFNPGSGELLSVSHTDSNGKRVTWPLAGRRVDAKSLLDRGTLRTDGYHLNIERGVELILSPDSKVQEIHPRITGDDLRDIVCKRLFPQLERGGVISIADIDRKIEEPNLTSEQVQTLCALKRYFHLIHSETVTLKQFGQELGRVFSDPFPIYLDKNNLDLFHDFSVAANKQWYALDNVQQINEATFDRLVAKLAPGKTKLSREQIVDELKNDAHLLAEDERKLLRFLEGKFDKITAEKMTKSDITEFLKKEKSLIPHISLVNRVESAMYVAQEVLKNTNRQLYGVAGDARSGIKPEAVMQGYLGDCFYLSGIGSMAACNPDAIKEMIRQKEDGTFDVKLPGADRTINVAAPTDANLALYAHGSEHGIWPAILERAYGKYCKETDRRHNRRTDRRPYMPRSGLIVQDEAGGGHSDNDGLQMMAPEGCSTFRMEWRTKDSPLRRPEWVAKLLQQCKDRNLPAAAGPPSALDPKESWGLHNLSVIGYRTDRKESPDGKHKSKYGIVILREQSPPVDFDKWVNCWREPGMDEHTRCMTVEEFTRKFDTFAAVVDRKSDVWQELHPHQWIWTWLNKGKPDRFEVVGRQ